MVKRKVRQLKAINPPIINEPTRPFMVFFELNSRFRERIEATSKEDAVDKIANLFGIHPKFLVAMEKSS